MPLYEYQCLDCGERFEKLVPISKRDEEADCPLCGGSDTQRVISVFAVSGFGDADVGASCPACQAGGACRLPG